MACMDDVRMLTVPEDNWHLMEQTVPFAVTVPPHTMTAVEATAVDVNT